MLRRRKKRANNQCTPQNAQIRHLKLPSSASNFPTSVVREEESIEKSSEELEEEELLELLELVELLVVLVEDGGVVASLVSGEVGEPNCNCEPGSIGALLIFGRFWFGWMEIVLRE